VIPLNPIRNTSGLHNFSWDVIARVSSSEIVGGKNAGKKLYGRGNASTEVWLRSGVMLPAGRMTR